MGVAFGSALTVIAASWTVTKATLQAKGLVARMQYVDDGITYTIFSIEEQTLVYLATIYKGTLPSAVVENGYSQAQNDADKTDFETSFKPSANASLTLTSTEIPGYVGTSSSTITAIRATAYTEQTTGAQRSVSSSSANDTSAGTGARTIKICYYDATLTTLKSEIVTMNGTSTVNTVATDICFIERIEVLAVGSTGGNVGTISLFVSTAGGGGTIGTIAPTDNQTNWCHHYVRTGRTAYVTSLSGGQKGGLSAGSFILRKANPLASPAVGELVIAPQLRVPTTETRQLTLTPTPVSVPGPARITLYVQPDAAAGSNTYYGGFGYYEG